MAKDIKHLSTVKPSDQKLYFIDANIWLLFLTPPTEPTPKQNRYLEFLKSQLRSERTSIVVTSMLISEIINRYLKDVSFNQYCKQEKISNQGSSYKFKYRLSDTFKSDYKLICSDIKIYFEKCLLCQDNFGQSILLNDLLSIPVYSLDYNDLYYYLICRQNKYSIVTDDSDFFVENVEIITCNGTLLRKYRDQIRPNPAKN